MLMVSVATLFQTQRFCREVIGGWAGDLLLSLSGVDLVVKGRHNLSDDQVLYTANHSSTLDLAILMSLRLPNARYFMKRRYLFFGPLGVVTALGGTLFTPPQRDTERRIECFRQAERLLRRTGESVFGSAEGTRVTNGEIGPFNRGVFHLATNLAIPIVPIYIAIPSQTNPGRGYAARPGTVRVHIEEPIDTSDWRVEDLTTHKEAVRARFVQLHASLGAT